MTNKQNNEISDGFSEENAEADAPIVNGEDFIISDGNCAAVKKDGRSINDDINDYVFTKPHKVKKYKAKSDGETHAEGGVYVKKRRKTNGKKKVKLWKKILIGFACVLLSLILLFAGTFMYLMIKGGRELLDGDYKITAPQGVHVQNDGEYVVYNGKTYQLNENITSILFMGVDKRELEQTEINGTGGQADVIVLAAVDTETEKVSLINVSRDTMTDVTVYSANGGYIGSKEQQICLSYAYGNGKETSCENTVNSVKRLFYNIPIKSYLALDLDGISAVNDSVGGVDVTSPETIGDFTKGQSYHLEGSMSESFVRLRHHENENANTLRMQRQQIYATEFLNKVIAETKKEITTPIDLFNVSSPYTCTDLNPSKICYLAESVVTSDGMSVEMKTVPGTAKMGETYAEYYVNETEFYELFLSVYYKEVK